MDPPNEERNVAKRPSRSDAQKLDQLDIALTPKKKARINAEVSQIMVFDIPDMKSGMAIWRKALVDAKSREVEIFLLKQKIEGLESKVVALEKNQINFDVFPIMDLPYEILLKILSYLPTNDILKRVALVSRKFYQISQDKHLLTKIEFEFKNHSEVLRWSDDQVDKYYNDFLEVVKESPKLKILSIKVKGGGHRNANLEKQLFPRQRQFFDELSLIKNQCVEEFCLKPCSYLWINHFVENVFGYLDKCPKLKIIKLHKISLFENLITAKKCLILNELKKTKLKTIEEFHFTFSGARLVAASLKSLLEIVLEKPNIKRIYLTRQNAEYRKELYQTCLDCGLGKNVKVVRDKPLNPGYSSVVLIVLQS